MSLKECLGCWLFFVDLICKVWWQETKCFVHWDFFHVVNMCDAFSVLSHHVGLWCLVQWSDGVVSLDKLIRTLKQHNGWLTVNIEYWIFIHDQININSFQTVEDKKRSKSLPHSPTEQFKYQENPLGGAVSSQVRFPEAKLEVCMFQSCSQYRLRPAGAPASWLVTYRKPQSRRSVWAAQVHPWQVK